VRDAGRGLYADVPAEQAKRLFSFRRTHVYSQVRVGGARWRYIGCGQGDRAVLFLPGAFMQADMWFNQILALENDYRVVAPDAYALQGVFDVEAVCRALVSSLDAEGIQQASVVGLSAGGGVAQALLQMVPERIDRVVFSHCGILRQSSGADRRTRALLWLVRVLPLAIIRRVLKRMTTGDIPSSSQWAACHEAYITDALLRINRGAVVGFLRSALDAHRRFRFDPYALASWPGSILILSSRDDALSQASVDQLTVRYPRAAVELLHEGGHHAFILSPEVYTWMLREFLSETSE